MINYHLLQVTTEVHDPLSGPTNCVTKNGAFNMESRKRNKKDLRKK